MSQNNVISAVGTVQLILYKLNTSRKWKMYPFIYIKIILALLCFTAKNVLLAL